jgi:thiosulfate reductase/polysulfide reductase chain A
LGATAENPWLNEITKLTDPYGMVIWINPVAAAKRGINDGDTIQVESPKGKMTGKVKITQRIHPECVGVGGNYGRRSMQLNPIAREGANYNQLLSMDDGSFSPISTALEISAKVKVTKV